MFFVIEASYVEDNAALWARHVDDHIAYLKEKLPVILAAGGLPGLKNGETVGALYIVEMESEVLARAFIEADPFARAGLFASIAIKPWRRSFFDGKYLAGVQQD